MFSLTNVVWYDGVDAHVSKYILETEVVAVDKIVPTKEAMEKTIEDIDDCEVLKIDVLRELSLKDVIEIYKQSPFVAQRFDEMYFMCE